VQSAVPPEPHSRSRPSPTNPANVLDKSIAIDISESIDPVKRGLRRRPQAIAQLHVAGYRDVLGQQYEKQRRGVDGSVIPPSAPVSALSELTVANLVCNLSGLLLRNRIVAMSLMLGQGREHVGSQGWLFIQHHMCRDDAVAAEQRHKIRKTGSNNSFARSELELQRL
jgi:hypothetical protein